MIKKLCIIGYGAHTKKTLIPSFKKLNNKSLKIISSKNITLDFEIYENLNFALNNLDKKYFFYNCTPPNQHFSTSKKILLNGFNLIIEKPICLNINQLQVLTTLARKKKLILIENMMYFQTKQFKYFNNIYSSTAHIKSLYINFNIPSFDTSSFRSIVKQKETLLLDDVLCYPLSLLAFYDIDLKNYELISKYRNKYLSTLKIKFKYKKINIQINVGFFKNYKNNVIILCKDKSSYTFNHFFYGKKLIKENLIYKNNNLKTKKINDLNAFSYLLKLNSYELNKLSNLSIVLAKKYLPNLNKIKKFLSNKSY